MHNVYLELNLLTCRVKCAIIALGYVFAFVLITFSNRVIMEVSL